MRGNRKRLENISGVTCLFLTLISCVVAIFTQNYYIHALFVFWLFILFIYFGLYKQSIIYLSVYIFTVFWIVEMVPKGIIFLSPMLLGMIYRFIVIIMAGYLTFSIPSGKLIAVFQKCSLPQSIVLILIVIIRFIPTISGEFKTIREAMKVRRINGSLFRLIAHPLQTMEYAVVPLIFRSIKIGDELAAAAIVRGIEKPTKKHSYYSISLGKVDIMILFISICLMVFSIII